MWWQMFWLRGRAPPIGFRSQEVFDGTLYAVALNGYWIPPRAHSNSLLLFSFIFCLLCILIVVKLRDKKNYHICCPGFQSLCGKSVLVTGWGTRETGPSPGTATGARRSPCGSATTSRRWGPTRQRTQNTHLPCLNRVLNVANALP